MMTSTTLADSAHVVAAAFLMKDAAAGRRATDVIRAPDQRLRVFVSSTLRELAPERQAVRDGVTSLRLNPVLFELIAPCACSPPHAHSCKPAAAGGCAHGCPAPRTTMMS